MNEVRISGLFRHPVKGFSPEPLQHATLEKGQAFPCDRLYAVETGPSGFDPAAPQHIDKTCFTVLMREAGLAKLETRFDEADEIFTIVEEDGGEHAFSLATTDGRGQLAAFMSDRFGHVFKDRMNVLKGPGGHRFMDAPNGDVSILNLASVQALSERMGVSLDPQRFRMNIQLEGLVAWAEDAWSAGRRLKLGGAVLEMVKPTQRCKATHANPVAGEYDQDIVPSLRRHFDRLTMGVYVQVVQGGELRICDLLSVDD